MNLKSFVPAIDWLRNYEKGDLRGDISAGITVGVMLIPQGMAYAMLAGLPPIYGLYASTLPLIVYAVFGTSRQLAVGPVAMVALLIASGVGGIAEVGSNEFIGLAILLAFMVGLFQLMLGLFRLGFLVNFLSHPVISGFTSAAALIIGLNQLKHLLGLDIARSNHIHTILLEASNNLMNIQIETFLIGTGGIAIIILFKKYLRQIPGPLAAVVVGILAVYIFQLNETGVKIVGTVPEGLPSFSFPSFNLDKINALIPTALTIGLVGFMESIAVAKAIQARHKNYKVDANQELIGLGLANIAGSVFKAFPTTGGFSRTAVNDQAGAKTGLSSIISAILIIITLLFLTPLFYYLPKAILASVIMVAVFGLIDYKEAIHLWKSDKKDFAMLAVTFVATLLTGIEEGIAIGVILSLAVIIFKVSYPHFTVLGRIPGTEVFRNIRRFPEAEQTEGVLIIRFDAQLFFANSQKFHDIIENQLVERKDIKLIIINSDSISDIDSSAIQMILDLHQELQKAGIKLIFTGLIGPVRDRFVRTDLISKLGEDVFYDNIPEALGSINNQSPNNGRKVKFQSDYKNEAQKKIN